MLTLSTPFNVDCPNINWAKEDLIRAAQKLTLDTDCDGIVDQYGLSLSSSFSRWPILALQLGVNFKTTTDQNNLYKPLDFIHDLVYRYKVAKLSSSNIINSEAFLCEKAAMVLTTAIEIAGWRNNKIPFNPEITYLRLEKSSETLLVANVFMIPSTSENQQLASKFIETALDEEFQKIICEDFHFLSVLKSVNDSQWNTKVSSSVNINNDDMEKGYFLHELISDFALIDELESEMHLYWDGMESAKSFASRMEEIFETNRELNS